jgi:hypothetical protein
MTGLAAVVRCRPRKGELQRMKFAQPRVRMRAPYRERGRSRTWAVVEKFRFLKSSVKQRAGGGAIQGRGEGGGGGGAGAARGARFGSYNKLDLNWTSVNVKTHVDSIWSRHILVLLHLTG